MLEEYINNIIPPEDGVPWFLFFSMLLCIIQSLDFWGFVFCFQYQVYSCLTKRKKAVKSNIENER